MINDSISSYTEVHSFFLIGGKRRRRSGSRTCFTEEPIMDLYVRKGTVVGLYFRQPSRVLRLLGSSDSENHLVCKQEGTLYNTTSITCNSDSLVADTLILVTAAIGK